MRSGNKGIVRISHIRWNMATPLVECEHNTVLMKARDTRTLAVAKFCARKAKVLYKSTMTTLGLGNS